MPIRRDNFWKDLVLAFLALVLVEIARELFNSLRTHPEGVARKWRLVLMIIALVPNVCIGLYFFNKLIPRTWISSRFIRFRISYWGTARDYMGLVRRWMEYIRLGPYAYHWQIRAAIAKEYADQEKLDLSGAADIDSRRFNVLPPDERARRNPEGRPLIITNFVRYSKLVEAMVNAALAQQRKQKDSVVLCIATLSMTLEKWLNFDDKAHSAHLEWEGYLRFLREKLIRLPGVVLARVLLVRNTEDDNPWVHMRSLDELEDDLNKWVWVTKRGPDLPEFKAASNLEPISWDKRKTILDELRRQFVQDKAILEKINELEQHTAYDRDSYLILPRNDFPGKPTAISGGEFVELRDAFKATFQTKKGPNSSYHAYYALVDPREYVPDPRTDDPPFPLDMFYVSMVTPQDTKRRTIDILSDPVRTPLFCLAARPDSDLHMVYLYMLDSEKCRRNFEQIEDYVTNLIDPESLLQL